MSAKLVLKSLQLVKRQKEKNNTKEKKSLKTSSKKIIKKNVQKEGGTYTFQRNMERLMGDNRKQQPSDDMNVILDYISNRSRRLTRNFAEAPVDPKESSEFTADDTLFDEHTGLFGSNENSEDDEIIKKKKKKEIFIRKR